MKESKTLKLKKTKKYNIVYSNYQEIAKNLLANGFGQITSLEVLVWVLRLARNKKEKVEFELPNLKVINMEDAQRMIEKDEFNE